MDKQFKVFGLSDYNKLDELFIEIDNIKKTNNTIIITDPNLVNDNNTRYKIHDHCNKLDISSDTIKLSGPGGIFMIIRPISEYVLSVQINNKDVIHLTSDDLELFIRLSGLPIDKKLLKSKQIFEYKMSVLQEFHLKHGNPDSLSPNQLFDMFIEFKSNAKHNIMKYITDISNKIIDYISKTTGYRSFNESHFSKIKNDKTSEINNTNPYKISVNEFWGISIDIKSANYNILKIYDSSIVNNTENWQSFVKLFTNIEFLAQSKPFRQEVLGKLNASRIANYQKKLLLDVVTILKKEHIEIDGTINSDELIIPASKNDAFQKLELIKNLIAKTEYPNIWRIEVFRVRPLIEYPTTSFYPFIKDTFTNNEKYWTSFVCTSKIYMTQVIKYFMNNKIDKYDLTFADEFGNIHTFDYPLVGKIENSTN